MTFTKTDPHVAAIRKSLADSYRRVRRSSPAIARIMFAQSKRATADLQRFIETRYFDMSQNNR